MAEKFIFNLGPDVTAHAGWWYNFGVHCHVRAVINNWQWITVVNRELRPFGGRLITPKTAHNYLRFDSEPGFTAFVLKWT